MDILLSNNFVVENFSTCVISMDKKFLSDRHRFLPLTMLLNFRFLLYKFFSNKSLFLFIQRISFVLLYYFVTVLFRLFLIKAQFLSTETCLNRFFFQKYQHHSKPRYGYRLNNADFGNHAASIALSIESNDPATYGMMIFCHE
jgi:hypothetical protein